MSRIDRDIKKRWLTFSLINFAIVVLLFGALLAGFAAYAFSAERGELEDSAEAYAARLAVPFSIAFVLIAAVASLVWGYTAIKPIMAGYVKQRNFINDMAHEIRTPLAVIKGNLENILAAPDSKVEEVADMLEASLREVDYMNDMSTGLLSIVRGQSKLAAHGSAVVSDVVSEVVDMFADMAAMGGKALAANIEHCDMPADREKIRQLLSALLENSMKYTSEGDRITVRLRNSKDGCVLTVTDTGIGVPKADLERIFDRFYRAENAKDTPGTGLGLPIAQAIAEGMGGGIKAVQNIPSGLEMVVHLKRGGAKTRSSSDET